jgi:hypothetical protein
MTMPKAYQPEQGYMFQILTRNTAYDREWDSLDHAKDRADLNYLLGEYRLAYRGNGHEFKVIPLPRKYWKAERVG